VPSIPLRVQTGGAASRDADSGDAPNASLQAGFDAIRAELSIPAEFSPAALGEATAAASGAIDAAGESRDDDRELGFFTVDPPGSMDLDQAVHAARGSGRQGGYVLHYAIADVAALVRAGGAIDAEARGRGVTVYLPDHRTPLHPPVLGEGAASLLPGVDRRALVWRLELDEYGDLRSTAVRRSVIRSRRRLTYAEAQAEIDGGTAEEAVALVAEIGRLREERERDRGGVSLPIPEQQVIAGPSGYDLAYRAPLAVEGWNAQISLLTGIAAAALMLEAGTGILRTLPPPSEDTIDQLRRRAGALGVAWPAQGGYVELIRSLNAATPAGAALLSAAARLFRGAGYVAFDGGRSPEGADRLHAGVAAPYAHVTAPLRRLVDRFANEIVLAASAGSAVPDWVGAALAEVPALMAAGIHREHSANSMALDLVEAAVLGSRLGQRLDATVVGLNKTGAQVQVRDPAIVATVASHHLDLGEEISVRVAGVDLARRQVDLEVIR